MRFFLVLVVALTVAGSVERSAHPFGDAHAARKAPRVENSPEAARSRGMASAAGGVLSTGREVHEALALACVTYGHCAWLRRVAWCESRFDPRAYNRASGATGLFQFLGSTFRSTPYGGADIYSPYAQALAAGWMVSRGQAGQWECR